MGRVDSLSTLAGISCVLLVIRLTEVSSITRAFRPMIVCGIVCLAALLFSGSRARLSKTIADPSVRAYLLLFTVAAIGTPFGVWPGQSLGILQSVLPFPLILLMTLAAVTGGNASLERILRCFVVGSFFGAVITLLLSSQLTQGGRLGSATSYDPNDLAALFALTVPITLGVASRAGAAVKMFSYGTAALLVALLFQTGSRGGLIALMVGSTVYLLGQSAGKAIRMLVLIAVLAPISWGIAPPQIRERLASVMETETDYNSTSRTGRVAIWKRGATYMVANPVLGVGLGNFAVAEGNFNESAGTRGAWLNAHNIFVQVGAELGVFGLAAFLFIIGRSAALGLRRWSLWGSRPQDRPELLAALASFVSSGMFLSHGYSTLFPFVAGICVISASGTVTRLNRTPPTGPAKRNVRGGVSASVTR